MRILGFILESLFFFPFISDSQKITSENILLGSYLANQMSVWGLFFSVRVSWEVEHALINLVSYYKMPLNGFGS